jgi:bifunctional DNA primase/polymerase-like protein/uncharacterized protein DUF3987
VTMPPTTQELLAAALDYTTRGWYVLPLHDVTQGRCSCGNPWCDAPGKHPRLIDWPNTASIDPAQLHQWWATWPHANVGVLTGERSGLAVLDVDPRNGGDLTLEDLVHFYGPLPETPMVISGGRGPHHYFALDGPLPKFDPGPGLNLLADGALVVVPPSLHHSGNRYEWEASSYPDDVPLSPLPEWLKAMGASRDSTPVAGVDLPDTLPSVRLQDLKVDHRIKYLIHTGEDPDDPTRYCYPNGTPDRSRALFAVIQAMLGAGHDDGTIASIVMDQRYGISAKVLSQKHARNPRYWEQTKTWVAKEIARAKAKKLPQIEVSEEDNSLNSLFSPIPWPELPEEAYYGLAGKIVRTIAPQTESDPAALLVQLLVMTGNCIGRTPYYLVEATRHYLNLFAALVGKSSKARKGTSADHIKLLLKGVDPAWSTRVAGGLSSGEGVIWNVRDAVYGQNKKGEEVCLDEGVEDKRLCILETEFARALAKTGQEGNVLSAVLRQAWDHGDLRTLVSGRQKAPVTASDAHVSICAHITADELRRCLTDTEAANGFGNRFLWVCVQRSKLLPQGGRYPEEALRPLLAALSAAILQARQVAQMQRTAAAEQRWEAMYIGLAEEQPGLLGTITARAEAQVLRLSCLYALLDKTDTVDVAHLNAAYALWRYCEDSARHIFGDMLGDPLADELRRMLRTAGQAGLTRTDINNALGRHVKSALIGQALARLQRDGFARVDTQKTSGRPVETWYATTPRAHVHSEKSERSEKRVPDVDLHSLHSLFSQTQCTHARTGQHGGQTVCLECGELVEVFAPARTFEALTASALWCATCGQAVRFRTLLQLDGTEVYLCATCDTEVGSKRTTVPVAPTDEEDFSDISF